MIWINQEYNFLLLLNEIPVLNVFTDKNIYEVHL